VLQGDFDAALTSYKSAIDIREGLLHKDPGNAYWQITLAPLYTEFAGVLKKRGDLPGALAQFRKSYALRQDLAQKDPFSKDRQNNLAIAGINVADVLAAQKQEPDEAIALYRDAIKILDEAGPKYDAYVFHSYLTIGEILQGEGKPDEAYQEYQIATGIARTAAEKIPGSAIWHRNLKSAIITVGDFLVEQGRRREALDHYQQALQFVESLAAKHPGIPAWAELAQLLHEKMQALRT
jgi:tetratricopeptide (TPR) repeat protein